MVKSLKFLRHRRTEAGLFSEFLIAKTPDDLENRAPAPRLQQLPAATAGIPATAIIFAAAAPLPTAAPAPAEPVNYVSLFSLHHAAAVTRQEEVASLPSPPAPLPQPSVAISPARFHQQQHPTDPLRVARRRERNRTAAAKCRQRRQDRLEYLADFVRELEAENGDLEAEVAELAAARARLESALGSHGGQCDLLPLAPVPDDDSATPATAVWLTQPPSPTPPPTLVKMTRPTSLSLSAASEELDELPSLLMTPRCGGGLLTPLLATPQSAKLESMLFM